mgnify:CR=1 FL=1
MIHLDTNVAIALLNGRQRKVRKRLDDTRAAGTPLGLSMIAYHELIYRAARSERRSDNESKIALFVSGDTDGAGTAHVMARIATTRVIHMPRTVTRITYMPKTTPSTTITPPTATRGITTATITIRTRPWRGRAARSHSLSG